MGLVSDLLTLSADTLPVLGPLAAEASRAAGAVVRAKALELTLKGAGQASDIAAKIASVASEDTQKQLRLCGLDRYGQ